MNNLEKIISCFSNNLIIVSSFILLIKVEFVNGIIIYIEAFINICVSEVLVY